MPLKLAKYSVGVGDRFAHQAKAQLQACAMAAQQGVDVVPVWNKSYREHVIIGSKPESTRRAADAAVRELGWTKPYHADADHINLNTVDGFLDSCDFYTIDVAESIGHSPDGDAADTFARSHPELTGSLQIRGIDEPFTTTQHSIRAIAGKYLGAVQLAGKIYRHIEAAKGAGNFIAEVSMDETDSPQTPPELLVILAAIAAEGIPIQTIAPKFTGRFNKGVDYVGDIAQFEKEFRDDIAVVAYAVQKYGLPDNLKLSVHSGSDKFSIYAPIRRALKDFNAGVHVKTAGTTWLEELIGLAEAGDDGLALAKQVYNEAYAHREQLCAPYAAVIDIDASRLPSPETVEGWCSEGFVRALRHDPTCSDFNPHVRQLLHVGYKVAAKQGERYLEMLRACEGPIAKNVTHNLFQRHIRPLFIGQ